MTFNFILTTGSVLLWHKHRVHNKNISWLCAARLYPAICYISAIIVITIIFNL